MTYDKTFRLCVHLLRGQTVTGRRAVAARRRVWRQSRSGGIRCHKFVDSYEAARAFLSLEEEKGITWL